VTFLRRVRPWHVALTVAVWLAVALLVQRWIAIHLFDGRELEIGAPDSAWQLELPWRASRGEWSGRDFFFPMGPIWQLLAWMAAGPGPIDPARALSTREALFFALSFGLAGWIARRAAQAGWARTAVFSTIAILATWMESLRALVSVAIVVLYVPADPDRPPRQREALAVAGATTLALLLSFERGVQAIASVVAMGLAEIALRRIHRQPVRPALLRLGLYAVALVEIGVVVAIVVAPILGASFPRYLSESLRVSSAYAIHMSLPWSGAASGSTRRTPRACPICQRRSSWQ